MSFWSNDVGSLTNVRCLGAILILIAASSGAAEETDALVFSKSAPEDASDLLAIERVARDVAKRAVPCTVGLEIRSRTLAQGSGVIVSDDGYILTAAHVVGQPGYDVRISFSDGKVAKGKTLGIHALADIGVVKITDKGKWPYAPLVAEEHGPAAGDWCLVTGHPNGFQAKRSAPVRFGRVVDVREHVLRTDCPIMAGDSGGPLFDMQGRVIGINSRISSDTTENLHGPVLACLAAWKQLEAGEVYPPRPASRFLDQLDVDHDGSLTRSELTDDFRRRVFDRLAEKFGLDPKRTYSIDELTSDFGWQKLTMPVLNAVNFSRERIGQSLSRRNFVRGREVRSAFADVVARAGESTVRVDCDGERVALGTVVRADGWVVTKASQLQGDAQCRLSDGRTLPAEIVGVDKGHDLAVLRIDAKDLTAVVWSTGSPELAPGSWLVTPGTQGDVESVGVLSVAARRIGQPAVLGVTILSTDNAARIAGVIPDSGAADAGILDGDVITHVMGHAVTDVEEIRELLQNFREGDVVTARIARGNEELKVDVTLGAPENVSLGVGRRRLAGPLSDRREGFPWPFNTTPF